MAKRIDLAKKLKNRKGRSPASVIVPDENDLNTKVIDGVAYVVGPDGHLEGTLQERLGLINKINKLDSKKNNILKKDPTLKNVVKGRNDSINAISTGVADPSEPTTNAVINAAIETELAPDRNPLPTPNVVPEEVPNVERSPAIDPPQDVRNYDIDIPGDFKKPVEDSDIIRDIVQNIKLGQVDEANKAIDAARNLASLAGAFRKDLSPEAMMVDRLRARTQRRLGKAETNQLTRSGQFEGEKRSPFDLGQDEFGRDLKAGTLLANINQSDASVDSRKRQSQVALLRLRSDIINSENKLKLIGKEFSLSRNKERRAEVAALFDSERNALKADIENSITLLELSKNNDLFSDSEKKETIEALREKMRVLDSMSAKRFERKKRGLVRRGLVKERVRIIDNPALKKKLKDRRR